MRIAFFALTVALALAGCDSGEVPNPADTQSSAPAEAPLAANAVELRGDGLATGSESFYFAAGQAEVESALVNVLGQKLRSGENKECGAGPITFTDFAGGLTAHFQKGRLVGWNWHAPQDGDVAAGGTIANVGVCTRPTDKTCLFPPCFKVYNLVAFIPKSQSPMALENPA